MGKYIGTVVIIFIIVILIFTAGCNSPGIKVTTTTKTDGTIVEERVVHQDVAAMIETTKTIEAQAMLLQSVAWLDPYAQTAAMARGDLFTDAMKQYIMGENAEVLGITKGVSSGVWGAATAFGLYQIGKGWTAASENAGDTITTGNISVTKSDDPIASGEGGGVASRDIGGQSVVIGSGRAATDQAQIVDNVDKNLSTPIRGDSNLDGNGDPSGIVIQDPDDVRNDASLF